MCCSSGPCLIATTLCISGRCLHRPKNQRRLHSFVFMQSLSILTLSHVQFPREGLCKESETLEM